jgi:hypothetical protein
MVKRIRLLLVLLFIAAAVGGVLYPRVLTRTYGSESIPQPTPKPKKKPSKPVTVTTPTPSKYSKFNHTTHTALKLACDSCHKFPTANWDKVRTGDAAFQDVTDYPKHESCINCHRPQFFSGKTPAICANCHTNPSPRDSSRHPFANPRELFDASPKGKTAESAFEVSFPHDKHIEIVSFNNEPVNRSRDVFFARASFRRAAEESCSVCHQTYKPAGDSSDEYVTPAPKDLGDNFWLKKGTFKTGPANHSTCFTCHSADTGMIPAPTDCATCHKLKQPQGATDFSAKLAEKIGLADKEMLLDWRRRDSSATFRHEWFSHAELSCASCHNAAAMNTTDPKTKKVPVISCGGAGSGCHITATSDDGGILNFEIDSRKKDDKFQCVKCHISYGSLPVPVSHTNAISEVARGGK